jgi:hypothetical protein
MNLKFIETVWCNAAPPKQNNCFKCKARNIVLLNVYMNLDKKIFYMCNVCHNTI